MNEREGEVRFGDICVNSTNLEAISQAYRLSSAECLDAPAVFLWGASTCAKSSILRAAESLAHDRDPSAVVLRLIGSDLVSEYMSAIRAEAKEAFAEALATCDFLLIDDLQELFGKAKTRGMLNEVLSRRCTASLPTLLAASRDSDDLGEGTEALAATLSRSLRVAIAPPTSSFVGRFCGVIHRHRTVPRKFSTTSHQISRMCG